MLQKSSRKTKRIIYLNLYTTMIRHKIQIQMTISKPCDCYWIKYFDQYWRTSFIDITVIFYYYNVVSIYRSQNIFNNLLTRISNANHSDNDSKYAMCRIYHAYEKAISIVKICNNTSISSFIPIHSYFLQTIYSL